MKYITDKFVTFIQESLNIIFSSVCILIIILCLKLFLNFLVPFLPLCIAFDQFEFTLCLFCFWLLCIALIIVSIYGHSLALWGSFCICFFLCIICHFVSLATLCHLLPFLYFVWVFLPPNDFVCPVSLQFCFFCLFCHISLFFLISCLSFGSLCAELLCILCYLFIVHALWSFLSLLSFILLAHSAPIFV